jgi:hypothetical protein
MGRHTQSQSSYSMKMTSKDVRLNQWRKHDRPHPALEPMTRELLGAFRVPQNAAQNLQCAPAGTSKKFTPGKHHR